MVRLLCETSHNWKFARLAVTLLGGGRTTQFAHLVLSDCHTPYKTLNLLSSESILPLHPLPRHHHHCHYHTTTTTSLILLLFRPPVSPSSTSTTTRLLVLALAHVALNRCLISASRQHTQRASLKASSPAIATPTAAEDNTHSPT